MVPMNVGDEDGFDLHQGDAGGLKTCLHAFSAIYQERAPMYVKYLSALISCGGGLGRGRAQYRQSEIHVLFTFLELVLEGCELADVTEGGLLKIRVDLLDSPLGGVSLSCYLLGLSLRICSDV